MKHSAIMIDQIREGRRMSGLDRGDETRHGGRAKRKRRSLEHDEQVALFEWAGLAVATMKELALLYAVPNGGHRHIVVAANMKKEGVKAGMPDVNLDVARRGYHGLRIEMKLKGRPLSDAQDEKRVLLEREGFFFKRANTSGEAIDTIKWYLGYGK